MKNSIAYRLAALCLGLGAALAGCSSLRPEPSYVPLLRERAALLGRSAAEVEASLGAPDRLLNVEGIGFYGYRDCGVYFDDIVFVYDKGGKRKIEGGKARAIVLDLLSPEGLMGIRRGKTKAEELSGILGTPSRVAAIGQGGEVFLPFAGTYHIYPLEGDFLAFRVEGGLVRSILLVDSAFAEFH